MKKYNIVYTLKKCLKWLHIRVQIRNRDIEIALKIHYNESNYLYWLKVYKQL